MSSRREWQLDPLDYCVTISRQSFQQSARTGPASRAATLFSVTQALSQSAPRREQDDRSNAADTVQWVLLFSIVVPRLQPEILLGGCASCPPDSTPPDPCQLRPWLNHNG
jgi:hypothetical protein